MPTLVGRPRYMRQATVAGQASDTYIGHEALSRKGVLKIKYPIEKGIVENWDDMQKVSTIIITIIISLMLLHWCINLMVQCSHLENSNCQDMFGFG